MEEEMVESVDNAVDEVAVEVIEERKRREADPVVVPEPEPAAAAMTYFTAPQTFQRILLYNLHYPYQYLQYAPSYRYLNYAPSYPHVYYVPTMETERVEAEAEMEAADSEPEPEPR